MFFRPLQAVTTWMLLVEPTRIHASRQMKNHARSLAFGTGQPFFFWLLRLKGDTIVIFFFVVRTAFGELMPHSDPPNIKH